MKHRLILVTETLFVAMAQLLGWIAVCYIISVLFSGCSAMDGYDRSHSFTYQDAEGRSMNYAINLRSTKGYAK